MVFAVSMVKEERKHVDSKIYELIEMSQMANNVIKERLLNVNFLLILQIINMIS